MRVEFVDVFEVKLCPRNLRGISELNSYAVGFSSTRTVRTRQSTLLGCGLLDETEKEKHLEMLFSSNLLLLDILL